MEILLVRVGADQSEGGGFWNAPVDPDTRDFVYASIPEDEEVLPGLAHSFVNLEPFLKKFNYNLPKDLLDKNMHLDPDFSHLTYGDSKERAKQIGRLSEGDKLIFYAGLKNVNREDKLVYAIIGMLTIKKKQNAKDIPRAEWDSNAHTRRLQKNDDIVLTGEPDESGRFRKCISIGEFRNRAYRVTRDLLDKWGGLSVQDGYIQRSARLPRLKNPELFLDWLNSEHPELISRNNV